MATLRADRLLALLLVTTLAPVVTPLSIASHADVDFDELLSLEDIQHLPLKSRHTRQTDGRDGDAEEDQRPGDPNCNFGTGGNLRLCDYSNPKMAALSWQALSGFSSNWLGGPVRDAEDADDGGYAVFETSSVPKVTDGPNRESAMLETPTLGSTGPDGKCLQFAYNMDGLSVDRLRVLLHHVTEEEKAEGGMADHRNNVVLWSSADVEGDWRGARQLYTILTEHTLVFEAIPLKGEKQKAYRGYIALDTIQLTEGPSCQDQCTFESRLCSWSQDDQDDFQWSLSRGTTKDKTGPKRDHGGSELSSLLPAAGGFGGGYVYIDSSYPRRPGDRARLLSRRVPATTDSGPLCFRFWTHMHGTGIGTLRVLLLVGDQQKQLWSLSGSAGNQWYQGQVPITSGEAFTLAIEAEVGMERLGDIAIDDLSLMPGVCPLSPLSASSDSIDCTFEVETCGWTNPGRRDGLDMLNWVRETGRNAVAPSVDHTERSERGYLLMLEYNEPQRAGDFAWLVSPTIKASEGARCLTFRYYMDSTIPSTSTLPVGFLRVLVEYENKDEELMRSTVWSVGSDLGSKWKYGQVTIDRPEQHKIIFVGIWGGQRGAIALDDMTFIEGACESQPAFSTVSAGDCDFLRGTCGWHNTTSHSKGRRTSWLIASTSSRYNGLNDHTLRTSDGYAYADVFSGEEVTMRLVSPPLQWPQATRTVCVSFYYAPLTSESSVALSVLRQPVSDDVEAEPNSDDETKLWTLTGAEAQDAEPSHSRISWRLGEVQMAVGAKVRVIFEIKALNYGFALDDISMRPGACSTRPAQADPSSKQDDEDTARNPQ